MTDVHEMWRNADPAHRGAVLLCLAEQSVGTKQSKVAKGMAELSPDVAASLASTIALGETYAIAAQLLEIIARGTP